MVYGPGGYKFKDFLKNQIERKLSKVFGEIDDFTKYLDPVYAHSINCTFENLLSLIDKSEIKFHESVNNG